VVFQVAVQRRFGREKGPRKKRSGPEKGPASDE
jgi:hypothetical protein